MTNEDAWDEWWEMDARHEHKHWPQIAAEMAADERRRADEKQAQRASREAVAEES